MTTVRIEVGDARHLDIPDRSARLVVTSPPYFGLRDYGEPGEIGSEQTPAGYVANVLEVLAEIGRILTPDGNAFLVIGDKIARNGGVDRKARGRTAGDPYGREYQRPAQYGVQGVPNGSLVGIPYRVALAAIDAGWVWRQDIVWEKPCPVPESVRRRCVRAHETVLHLSRTPKNYAAPQNRGGGLGPDVWSISGAAGYRDPGGFRHSAVYPEALVERIVSGWSAPGDLVVDPFVGSGTSAVVAERMGRTFYGVDLSPDSVACAVRRREDAAGLFAYAEDDAS